MAEARCDLLVCRLRAGENAATGDRSAECGDREDHGDARIQAARRRTGRSRGVSVALGALRDEQRRVRALGANRESGEDPGGLKRSLSENISATDRSPWRIPFLCAYGDTSL